MTTTLTGSVELQRQKSRNAKGQWQSQDMIRVVLTNGTSTAWHVQGPQDFAELAAELTLKLGRVVKFRDLDDLPRKFL